MCRSMIVTPSFRHLPSIEWSCANNSITSQNGNLHRHPQSLSHAVLRWRIGGTRCLEPFPSTAGFMSLCAFVPSPFSSPLWCHKSLSFICIITSWSDRRLVAAAGYLQIAVRSVFPAWHCFSQTLRWRYRTTAWQFGHVELNSRMKTPLVSAAALLRFWESACVL